MRNIITENICFPEGEEREYCLIESLCRTEECEGATVYGIRIKCSGQDLILTDISNEKEFVLKLMRKMELHGAVNILECAEDALEEKFTLKSDSYL